MSVLGVAPTLQSPAGRGPSHSGSTGKGFCRANPRARRLAGRAWPVETAACPIGLLSISKRMAGIFPFSQKRRRDAFGVRIEECKSSAFAGVEIFSGVAFIGMHGLEVAINEYIRRLSRCPPGMRSIQIHGRRDISLCSGSFSVAPPLGRPVRAAFKAAPTQYVAHITVAGGRAHRPKPGWHYSGAWNICRFTINASAGMFSH